MKTSLLTTLSFLLLLSYTKLHLAHSDGNKPVLDIYNNTVISGTVYFIDAPNTDCRYISYGFGPNALPCPFNVVCGQGAAITEFFLINGSSTIVTESTSLVVTQYVGLKDCGLGGQLPWKVNTYDTVSKHWPVVFGAFNEVDSETQFTIEGAGYIGGQAAYKFVYSPPGSGGLNLTLSYVEGYYRLVVESCPVAPGSQFVFTPGAAERIKLVTSN